MVAAVVDQTICAGQFCVDLTVLACELECTLGISQAGDDVTLFILDSSGNVVAQSPTEVMPACDQGCGAKTLDSGVFTVGPQQTVTLTSYVIQNGDIDHNQLGYSVNGGPKMVLANSDGFGGAAGGSTSDVIYTNSTGVNQTIVFYLEDLGIFGGSPSCDFTYYSSNANHSINQTNGDGSISIAFGDSIVCGCDPTCSNVPAGYGDNENNATMTIVIASPGTA